MSQLQAEGVEFRVNSHVGVNVPVERIVDDYDAVILAAGCEKPRGLPVPGRELQGVHYAMPYLTQQNRRLGRESLGGAEPILAEGKHVVVIGGGDTGADCVGTANRQGAASVTQLELLPQPPEHPDKLLTWPQWPSKLRTSTSHDEGCERLWSVSTKSFSGNGVVQALQALKVDWQQVDGSWEMSDVAGTDFELQADLVLLAMGFVNPIHEGMIKSLDLSLDERGNVLANELDYATSRDKFFVAGDMRRGQSLVVWAIREGRQAAHSIDKFLMGATTLPR